MSKNIYYMGNCLRGYYEGKFETFEEAFKVLSARFYLSFPSSSGRSVLMYCEEINKYGLEDRLLCYRGTASMESYSGSNEKLCKIAQRSTHFYR